MEAIHESRLLLEDYGGNRHIGVMAVHRHIFDELVKMDWDYWGGGFNFDIIKQSSGDYIHQMKEHLAKGALILSDTQRSNMTVEQLILLDDPFLMFQPSRTFFGDYLEGVGQSGAARRKLYRTLLAGSLDSPELDDVITEISKFVMFEGMFANMRKTWMPQAGAGSQSEEHEIYEVVNKAAAEVIKKRKEYYDE